MNPYFVPHPTYATPYFGYVPAPAPMYAPVYAAAPTPSPVAAPPLFDSALLPETSVRNAEKYALRPLARDDFANGHTAVLADLTDVGDTDEDKWVAAFDEMRAAGVYYIVVVEEIESHRVVGTGTLVVERKFAHGTAKAGHIEDIVVSSAAQGEGIGSSIINALLALSLSLGSYKTILDCADKVRSFYEKLGFEHKGNFMAVYHQAPAPSDCCASSCASSAPTSCASSCS